MNQDNNYFVVNGKLLNETLKSKQFIVPNQNADIGEYK